MSTTLTFTDKEFELLTSFVEMAADQHIDLMNAEPDFAFTSEEKGFTKQFAAKLAVKCGSKAKSLIQAMGN